MNVTFVCRESDVQRLGWLTVCVALSCSFSAHAASLFDFEGLSATNDTGSYTSLTQTSGGLTATFTRPGSTFDIDNLTTTGQAPSSFGSSTLSPFSDPSSNTPFVINFSQGLTGLSFQAGDFYSATPPGDLDTITLKVFAGLNGQGTVVGTATPYDYGTGSLPGNIASLSVNASTPFLSAVVIGGSSRFPNSVFYDNFSATLAPVPLPASLPMLSVAILGLGLWSRGRKRSSSAS
jgi:hypothetical protein